MCTGPPSRDRKSTRLNSSHVAISYAVFCLKKKKNDSCSEGYPRAHARQLRSSAGPAAALNSLNLSPSPYRPIRAGISSSFFSFFFNDTATTEIYTLSLHDALPIFRDIAPRLDPRAGRGDARCLPG